ncbi:MAG: 50S ribosomal protein L15 [Nitrospirales bacterium]|nr:50S ribosomal protein L15 [Nitrospira sp. NTP2]MCK6500546.1 50S ribosomal protein L15 [Nitrospira sp.]MEB2338779.1 50S ribosomal protein L15 [Nitrospirales bacterium]QOJ34293.1 MAG: 50S ribosomal protein L15 [Nitrospira sp.]RIK58780.1 MAG: 50S ribosomal protein L15 [Nitrospira sp.]
MKLHELAPSEGATKRRKRIGRGPGSGHGKTATKGHKGLKARSGGGKQPGFEGGQMPLIRRVPKYGFSNPFRTEYAIVNLKSLAALETTEAITPQLLMNEGLVRRKGQLIKILAQGELNKPLVIQAHKFSKSAEAKIQAAGGRAEVIPSV